MADNTVKVDLVTVNTQKVEKSTQTLKARIKELKLQLEQLDSSSKKYQETLTQLGNLQHQQNEINERARYAMEDYGQTLSNVTSVATGAVASFSAINGVMNLIGNSSSEAQEAMLKIQSLMAVVQGLSALDTAEKNFQALWVKVKALTAARTEESAASKKETASTTANTAANKLNATSITAQTAATGKLKIGLTTLGAGFKNLGRAMKAFAASNPFTLIIMAITTAIELVSKFISKAREAAKEAREVQLETINSLEIEDFKTDPTTGISYLDDVIDNRRKLLKKEEEILSKLDNTTKSYREANKMEYLKMMKDIKELADSTTTAYDEMKKAREDYSKYTNSDEDRYSEYGQAAFNYYYKKSDKYYENLYNTLLKRYEQKMIQMNMYKTGSVEYDDYKKQAEALKEQINKNIDAMQSLYTKNVEYRKGLSIYQAKQEQEAAAQAKEAANRRKEAQTKELKDLQDKLAEEQKLNENAYNKQEVTEQQYLEKNIQLLTKYYEDVKKLQEKKNPEADTKMIADIEGNILAAQRKLAELNVEIINARKIFDEYTEDFTLDESEYVREQTEAVIAEIKKKNQMTSDIQEGGWIDRYNTMLLQSKKEIELEKQKNEDLYEYDMQRLEDEKNIFDLNYVKNNSVEVEKYERNLEAYKAQLDGMLITREQYEKKVEDEEARHNAAMKNMMKEYEGETLNFEKRRVEIEQEYANERYRIVKEELQMKIEAAEQYFNAYQTIVGGVSGLLSEIQSNYDQNSQAYKDIAITNAITDTISGTLSAYMSGIKSGLMPPFNMALATTMAALTFATGVAQINNLKKGQLTNSATNANASSGRYETLSYETMTDLNGNIRDQRIYVVENDISSTQQRVSVTESEATF